MRRPRNTSHHSPSLLGSLVKTGLTMIGFGIGLKAFRSVSFAADVGLGKMITSALDKESIISKTLYRTVRDVGKDELIQPKFHTFVRDLHQKVIGAAEKSIRNINTTMHYATSKDFAAQRFLSHKIVAHSAAWGEEVARRNKPIENLIMLKSKDSAKQIRHLKDIRFSTIVRNTEKVKNMKFVQKLSELKHTKLLEKSGDLYSKLSKEGQLTGKIGGRDFGKVMAARFVRYASDVGSYAAFDYAFMRAVSHDDKHWYQPSAVADWAGFTLGSDVVFRGLGPLGGLAKKKIKPFARKLIDSINIKTRKKIVDKALKFANKVVGNKFVAAFRATRDELEGINSKPPTLTELPKRVTRAFKTLSKNYNNDRKIKEYVQHAKRTPIERSLENVEKELAKEKNQPKSEELRSEMNDALKEQYGVGAKYYNGKIQKRKDTFFINIINKFVGEDYAHATKASSETIRKFNSVFEGKVADHTLRDGVGSFEIEGKKYNITELAPANLLHHVTSFMSTFPKVMGIPVFGVLGINPHIAAEADVIPFKVYSGKRGEQALFGVPLDTDALAKMNVDAALQGKLNPDHSKNTIAAIDSIKDLSEAENRHFKTINKQEVETLSAHAKVYKEVMDYTIARGPDDKGKFMAGLKSGRVELADGESSYFIGDKMYLHIKKPNKPGHDTVFQLGYDVARGTYHSLHLIPHELAGSLPGLMKKYLGVNQTDVMTNGKNRTVENSSMTARHRSPYDATESPMYNLFAYVKEKLELGSKEKPSILKKVTSFFTKSFKSSNLHNLFHTSSSYNNSNINNIEVRNNLEAALPGVLNTLDGMISKNISSDKELITGITGQVEKIINGRAVEHSDKLVSMFNAAKNLFIFDPTNLEATRTSEFKKNLNTFMGLLGDEGVVNVTTASDRTFLTDFANALLRPNKDVELTQTMAKHHKTVHDIKLNKREVWNNLLARLSLKTLDHDESLNLVNNMKIKDLTAHQRKNVDLISAFDILNSKPKYGASKKIKDNYIDNISSYINDVTTPHHEAMEMAVNKIEPAIGFSSNLVNNEQGYGAPIDVIISSGKDITGKKIMDPFSSLFPKMNKDGSGSGATLFEKFKSVLSSVKGGTTPASPLTSAGLFNLQIANSLQNVGAEVGLSFDEATTVNLQQLATKMITKRILPAVAIGAAWHAADAFMDQSPLFDGTVAGEGLNVLTADVAGRARLAMARINDVTQVTGVSNYLENLMPGFINSPAMGALRGFGSPVLGAKLGMSLGGPVGGLMGGAIGTAVSIFTAGGPLATFSRFDPTKSRKDIIEEYSGRVSTEYKKSPNWLLSMSPMAGSKTEYFGPSWYHETLSQYKNTPTFYGTKFEQLVNGLNPGHYAKKLEITRPYPFKSKFNVLPLVGNALEVGAKASPEDLKFMQTYLDLNGDKTFADDVPLTISNSLSNGLTNATLTGVGNQANQAMSNYNRDSNFLATGKDLISPEGAIGSPDAGMFAAGPSAGIDPVQIISPTSAPARIKNAEARFENFVGFRGFFGGSIVRGLNYNIMPMEQMPQLQPSARMTGFNRAYWDSRTNDLFGATEFIRRMVPKMNQHMNEVNDMPNVMPSWLPSSSNSFVNFAVGDPYVKIKKGELRLPGAAYETAHDVEFTAPLQVSQLGMTLSDQINYLTGKKLPNTPDFKFQRVAEKPMAQAVAAGLTMQNQQVQMDAPVYDPNLDMAGKADIMTQDKVIQVKPVSDKTFKQLSGPLNKDYSQMNALLNMSRKFTGTITYVNAETGDNKEFTVTPDPDLYRQDVQTALVASAKAQDVIRDEPHSGRFLANAYSRLDRLRILSDVAPFSQEFKTTQQQVQAEMMAGKLTDEEQDMYDQIMNQHQALSNRYNYNDYRFLRGTPVTEEEKELQDNIKKTYSRTERGIGSAWEKISHSNTLGSIKLMDKFSPLEQYINNEVHGNFLGAWRHPYIGFVRPLMAKAFNQPDMVNSAVSAGSVAQVFFGVSANPFNPVNLGVGVAGAAVGGLVGMAHTAGTPKYKKKERELIARMDKVRYIKDTMAAGAGDMAAAADLQKTMTYGYESGAEPEEMAQNVPRPERAFMNYFMRAGTVQERNMIAKNVPDYVLPILQKSWDGSTDDANPLNSAAVPDGNWQGYDPSLKYQDVLINEFNREGYDPHDMGLGWQSDMRRLFYVNNKLPSNGGNLVQGDEAALMPVLSSIQSMGIEASGSSTVASGVTLNVRYI